MGLKKFSGADKAAIVLMALGEDLAGQVVSQLSPQELRRIGGSLNKIKRVDTNDVDAVIDEFQQQLTNKSKQPVWTTDGTKRLLAAAAKQLDPEARVALEQQLDSESVSLNETIARFEPRALATYLKHEHPQTVALILAHCPAKACGEVIKLLPDAMRSDLLLRIARLESVDPDTLQTIEDALRQELDKQGHSRKKKIGGIEAVAALLNTLDKSTEQGLLETLDQNDPKLGEQVRQLMFRFVDLVKIDSRGLQEVLKQVKPETLRLALKSAPEPVKKAILASMSSRAANLLEEDIASLAKQRLADVEAAQAQIAQIARRLVDEGKVVLQDGKDVYV